MTTRTVRAAELIVSLECGARSGKAVGAIAPAGAFTMFGVFVANGKRRSERNRGTRSRARCADGPPRGGGTGARAGVRRENPTRDTIPFRRLTHREGTQVLPDLNSTAHPKLRSGR